MNPLDYLAIEPRYLMAQHAKTFAFAGAVLSKDQLGPIARLYQICRVIDDCADELPPIEGRQWLQKLKTSLVSGSDQFGKAFRDVESRGVERRYVAALIEGGLFDVDQRSIQTEGDLLHYCYLVAGVVGLMMCPLLGGRSGLAQSYARDLGIAMQLTNICRDVRLDASMGRIYLPDSQSNVLALAQAKSTPDGVKSCLRKWLGEADRFYESAYLGLAFLPLRARFCILIAGEVYRAIGAKIRRSDYEVHARRVYLTKMEKVVVACKALRRTLRLSFWIKPRTRRWLAADELLRGVEALYL